jgi:predicted dehydrogenase
MASRAIAAGKHVLVEKPMGVTVQECEALKAEVEASGLTLQVGTQRRFDEGIAHAHDFISRRSARCSRCGRSTCSVTRVTSSTPPASCVATSSACMRSSSRSSAPSRGSSAQIEGFADTILTGAPQVGADAEDGLAVVRTLAAIQHSLATGDEVEVAGFVGAV